MSIRNMVLSVERNSESVRNGRRSRGPSPNGHGGTPESSSDDDCKLNAYTLDYFLFSKKKKIRN